MDNEKIIREMRLAAEQGESPVDIAMLLGKLLEEGLTQSTFIIYFKQAFPSIKLRTLIELGAWSRLTDGVLTDDDVNSTLEAVFKEL